MIYLQVYIEHAALSLNRPFTYSSEVEVKPGCRVKVPFNGKELIGFVTGTVDEVPEIEVSPILEVLDTEPMNEELMELAQYISSTCCASLISVWKTMLPPALRPTSNHSSIVEEEWFEKGESNAPLTKRQQEVYDMLLPQLPMKAPLARKLGKGVIRPLLDKGALISVRRPKTMFLASQKEMSQPLKLTAGQQAAMDQIRDSSSSIFLLHGVTGSGKTEIFLQLARQVIDSGRQVLFLVPEIGLTPMMTRRVASRFGNEIAVYHSGLSAQEKYAQYELVRQGKVSIVVGTRSACFMPFSNLGLILMDEEHDASYKQDSMPRYHTRDVVAWRANYHKCKLVLASATPSLYSYSRTVKNVYERVDLPERINETMPDIQLVDMRHERVINGLSQTLVDAIRERLVRKEQTILLLNRRGWLPVVRCLDCGAVRTCPDCGVALSWHKDTNRLVCHCCDNSWPYDPTCPECGSHYVRQSGMGTEKLVQAVADLFPEARIIRMDADTTRKKNSHQKILEQFETEGDILIGTQMVAKGLDFPNVTLVGLLQVDNALTRTDYRASESAYSMIEQASGRAGRADKPGEVMIQTFDPDNFVLQDVKDHAYRRFFKEEMDYRHLADYPPYTYMCQLVFIHTDEAKARGLAEKVKQYLAAVGRLSVIGPAAISMRVRKQRVRLVIKTKDTKLLEKSVWDVVGRFSKGPVKIDINMHPLMLEE